MRWDYKLVSYLLLTYFIYGIVNLLALNDFVVPLPLSFIFAPLIALTFAIKTKPSLYTLLFLAIPLLMLKDLIIYYNETLGIILSIIGLLSWMILGGLLLKKSKSFFLKVSAIGLLIAPLLLIGIQYLSFAYLTILLIASYKTLQDENNKLQEPLERSLLLFTFINALYILNEVSNYIVKF